MNRWPWGVICLPKAGALEPAHNVLCCERGDVNLWSSIKQPRLHKTHPQKTCETYETRSTAHEPQPFNHSWESSSSTLAKRVQGKEPSCRATYKQNFGQGLHRVSYPQRKNASQTFLSSRPGEPGRGSGSPGTGKGRPPALSGKTPKRCNKAKACG